MIDEVDKASDYHTFLTLLGLLRRKFLQQQSGRDSSFHSVILAGVHDIKNIKRKLILDGKHVAVSSEGGYNSPWNIAADFDVEMSFNAEEISTMLEAYESENSTGMDIGKLAYEIYRYTHGYPFLVSRICQHIDQRLDRAWSASGVKQAVEIILLEQNTLFDDLTKNLSNNPELADYIFEILILGEEKPFNIDNPQVNLGAMYGYFSRAGRKVAIHNRIFEQRISNMLIDSGRAKIVPRKSELIHNGRLDMELVLRKFAEHFSELYDPDKEEDRRFLERHGRMLFLSYLRPVINGHGFYHIESQLTDDRRMDIVVDVGREQFIIELKVWRGEAEHGKAYEQLAGYLESKQAQEGYLLTFDFRKGHNRERRAQWVEAAGKRIFDVIV
jgi:hypothetical protein